MPSSIGDNISLFVGMQKCTEDMGIYDSAFGRLSIGPFYVTWGSIAWLTQSGPTSFSSRVRNRRGHCTKMPTRGYILPPQCIDSVWEIIANITAWHIWKARCSKAIEGIQIYDTQFIYNIWSDIVHNLMATWARMEKKKRIDNFNDSYDVLPVSLSTK